MKPSLDIFELPPAAGVKSDKGVLDEKDKKMVCLLIAIGEPEEAVARKLGFSKAQVSAVIRGDDGIEMIIRLQTAAFPDPHARVKRMANLALDTQLKLMLRSDSDAVVAKITSDILDRSMGKATQVVENRNLNVNITDMASADRALTAQHERLARLEAQQQKLLKARAAIKR
jgi:hypothetical protein